MGLAHHQENVHKSRRPSQSMVTYNVYPDSWDDKIKCLESLEGSERLLSTWIRMEGTAAQPPIAGAATREALNWSRPESFGSGTESPN